jgi:hypothetical protein
VNVHGRPFCYGWPGWMRSMSHRALGVQLVCTVHVVVVGRQYDDGLVGEACSVELRQHSNDVVIRIAQATAGSY